MIKIQELITETVILQIQRNNIIRDMYFSRIQSTKSIVSNLVTSRPP